MGSCVEHFRTKNDARNRAQTVMIFEDRACSILIVFRIPFWWYFKTFLGARKRLTTKLANLCFFINGCVFSLDFQGPQGSDKHQMLMKYRRRETCSFRTTFWDTCLSFSDHIVEHAGTPTLPNYEPKLTNTRKLIVEVSRGALGGQTSEIRGSKRTRISWNTQHFSEHSRNF